MAPCDICWLSVNPAITVLWLSFKLQKSWLMKFNWNESRECKSLISSVTCWGGRIWHLCIQFVIEGWVGLQGCSVQQGLKFRLHFNRKVINMFQIFIQQDLIDNKFIDFHYSSQRFSRSDLDKNSTETPKLITASFVSYSNPLLVLAFKFHSNLTLKLCRSVKFP